jgi:DedD protein
VKERLTGAIILVVLIVLLVPELLSGPKGPAALAPAGAAPTSSEEPPLRSYTINLGDDSHTQTQASESNGPAMPQPSGPEQPTAQASAPPSTSDQSAAQSESASAPAVQAPSTVKSTPPAPKSAATQNPPPPTPPATARAEAPKPAHGSTTPAVAEKPPKAHPPVTPNTAPTSESGWGVQLGVFASHENAERLALEVRVKGFKASVSPVTSHGRKLFRVRVGPTPDRSAAQELQGRLKAAGRPGGTVVPYS